MKDSNKGGFGEIGWECVQWIHVTQGMDQQLELKNTVMNIRVA